MPTTKVRLPDGTVIRLQVPEGATPEQIHAFAKKHVSEEAVIKRLLQRIKKPEDGEDGKSIKGDKGDPGKSVKGDKGDKGDPGKSIKGDKGDKGVSIVDVQLNKKKELITTLSNGKKINAGKITHKLASDVFEVFYTNPLKNTTNLGSNIGDMTAFNGKSWEERAVGNTGTQYLAPNNADPLGVSWQDKGVSYLTDELGNALTDELGNALEGVDTVDARLLVNVDLATYSLNKTVDEDTLLTLSDNTVFCNSTDNNITITLPPAASAYDFANAVGIEYKIKKIAASNTVTIDPDGDELIDDASTEAMTAIYATRTITTDGTQWWIV